ncbi:recombinase family protein [Pacificibacter sp. AS14]|uniref:recombinase family protein n=1 Tax=Pacificibacter sp. AS14 TaxID=3135785 RepID=UPI0031718B4D
MNQTPSCHAAGLDRPSRFVCARRVIVSVNHPGFDGGDNRGTLKGQRVINATEAAVVRRIFSDYLVGVSPKKIAFALNNEGIAAPTARHWGPSTIYGNRERGTGILNNELYNGRLVWNRLRYAKDPETGKRVSRLNPEAEWITKDLPDLRIIDQATWDAVKHKQGAINTKAKSGFWKARRPKNLFSYLIKCGECGGGCSSVNATQIGCSSARNKGTCSNRLTISRNYLEEDILGALQGQLMDPELCALFCKEYTEHLNRLRRTQRSAAEDHRLELSKLERERMRIVDAIKDGLPAEMVRDEAQRISARIAFLTDALAQDGAAAPILHPAMADMYAREVQKLITTLNEPDHREEAAGLIRGLIDRIVLTPDASKTRLIVDLEGDLAGILAMSADQASLKRPNLLGIDTFGAFSSLSYRLGESVSHYDVGINGCGSRI